MISKGTKIFVFVQTETKNMVDKIFIIIIEYTNIGALE